MLDIVNIYKLTDGMLLEKTNIIQNEYMFLAKRGSFWGNPPRSYLGIEKFNILNAEIEEFKFDNPVNFVSDINFHTTTFYALNEKYKSIIYYGYINSQLHNYCIDLYKLNCNNWNKEEFLNIDIGIEKRDGYEDCIPLMLETQLISIDERYCLVFIPNILGCIKDKGIFCKALLVDFFEKKSYKVPEKIGMLDCISRIDEVIVTNNRKNIIIKTLRIHSSEKREIWGLGIKEKKFKEYENSLENLAVLETEKFIKDIKNNKNIEAKYIIETVGFNESLQIMYINNTKIIYSIDCFESNDTFIKEYYFSSSKVNKSTIKGVCSDIRFFRDKLYKFSFSFLEEEFQVIDVINENKTLTSKDSIIYIDDNIFITEITSAQNSHISILTIYDFDNNVIDILECRTYCFDYEKNRLVLL